jgi:acylphosphatase
MEKVRAHVFFDGYVQGVFFRAFTRNQAARYRVTGWVKNLPDGRVEAVLEGDYDMVAQMIKVCEKGPPGARVLNTTVDWEKYTGEFSGFSITY